MMLAFVDPHMYFKQGPKTVSSQDVHPAASIASCNGTEVFTSAGRGISQSQRELVVEIPNPKIDRVWLEFHQGIN